MDIQNYVASGMIEGYLFGLATAEEREEFERRLKLEPKLQQEFELAQENMLLYNQLLQKEIPSLNKEQIWQKLNGTTQLNEPEKVNIITSAENMVVNQASNIVRFMPFVVAASLALFSISAFMAWNYKSQLNRAEEKLVDLETKTEKAIAESDKQKEAYEKSVKLLNIFNQDGIRMVKLTGKDISPQSSIMVCWNRNTDELMVHDMKMPAPPEGKAYQFWVLSDKKMVSVGMVDMKAAKEMISLKEKVAHASAFAITLEDEEGEEEPTLDQMYVYGSL